MVDLSNTVLPPVGLARPKPVDRWTLADVRAHLAFAVNLEIWTIPYYLTVMFSIKDIGHPAFRLVQSVAHQEMLHAQLAANLYNSFQPSEQLRIGPFRYTREGGVPHLDFALDPEAVKKYGPPDACLGGLDLVRLGTMCLIELPESHPPPLDPDRDEYATLGDFYTALRFGMRQHAHDVRGNHNQVDHFANFYRNLGNTTVTEDGPAGLNQALRLVDVITEQGEGRTNTNETIPLAFQNTADDFDASSSHFEKFNSVRDAVLSGRAPATYSADPHAEGTAPQQVLGRNFAKLVSSIREMFNGRPVCDPFGALMSTVGANVLACWRQGVVPRFSDNGSKA
ncbi:ferritin-like domain-containing protein [Actinophytocola sp.]|uniref:ferritin-like domain-containing protein n=1 Tax=Actinophytocola sp. TaxID=1872138 RepID=UPI002ED4888D